MENVLNALPEALGTIIIATAIWLAKNWGKQRPKAAPHEESSAVLLALSDQIKRLEKEVYNLTKCESEKGTEIKLLRQEMKHLQSEIERLEVLGQEKDRRILALEETLIEVKKERDILKHQVAELMERTKPL